MRQQGQDKCGHNDFRVRTWMVLELLRALRVIHPEVYDDPSNPWQVDWAEIAR